MRITVIFAAILLAVFVSVSALTSVVEQQVLNVSYETSAPL